MSLFWKREASIDGPSGLIPPRPSVKRGTAAVTNDTALRHSAVWACLRLRADLISTLPLDVFRRVNGVNTEMPKPPVLVNPGGEQLDMLEWRYSTQVDLDRCGNTFGLITDRDARGLPARIDLVPLADVSVVVRSGQLVGYRIDGTLYEPDNVWHEKQFTLPGVHLGLSPVAYAAWSIGEYLSAQEFALDWFGNGAVPSAHLKNTQKTLTPGEAGSIKSRFRASVASGDVFVTGNDWEYKVIQASASDSEWLNAKRASISDISRFFGVPSDLIDAAISGQSVTYANITQRNLQLLILHIGPAVTRRENALNKVLPAGRFVKLNTDALLRMDPKTRAETLKLQIDSRTIAPSEVRELEDRPPFTSAQIAEFDQLFGPPRTQPSLETGVTS